MTVPKLLSKAWASNGLKNDIPAERSDGLPKESATYSEGFPQITMTPIAMGGKAPSGKDMNGVLNELSDHIVYQNKGGIYPFNAEFAEKIGGYPKGAILINDRLNLAFQSLVDNNKTNFNTQNYSGKWVVVFGNDFFVPKTQTATISRAGIVQLSNDDNTDDETKAPTLKAIKKLKGFYDGLRRLLDSYIPNSKKSNAVNSPSSETVATSAAVKSANDNANGRVSKSGDTMTGDLSIKNGEYSKLKLYNASGKEFRFESTPDSSQVFGKASYRSADGATEYHAQYFPKKSGTIALTNEVIFNSGNQSVRGILKAENVGGAWAAYQWGAKQGFWQLEVHPDSHTAGNRRFNMLWSPDTGARVYLGFPHIGDNGETVAYQSWVNAELQKVRSIANQNSQNFNNYIHNNKKSNAADSNSTDTLATSRAVKLAFDRGTTALNAANSANTNATNANNNANSRVSKSGDTITGNLHIKSGDYSSVRTYNTNNEQVRWESVPASDSNGFAKITRVDSKDNALSSVYMPKKSGTVALLEDIRNVNRRDYNRTIKGTNPNWDAGTSKNIAVTGYVVIYPDGKIEQYFYFRNFRIHWFLEEQARDGHHRIIEIPLQLWTAMPNKIEWVEAHISRTNDTNLWSQRTVGSEASEWTKPIWAFEKQGSIKDRLSLYTRRIYGDTNETVDMYIKIEGY